ncbi:MAG: tRNA uridine-5-carboxymethylaminomethyl(34) synthesis GTPase MnmE [Propylenella sp.]
MDSIYALSSGAAPSGVAVIRISGPRAGDALVSLCGKLPEPRRATLRALRRPGDGAVLDRGLVLWFPGPRSETGEDMTELQAHGSRAVIQAIFEVLSSQGLRLAEPGEFIRRAFVNGKIDLTEVEGLADLIAAETEVQRRQAIGQAGGALAKRAEEWREKLIGLRAEIEARLDFSDEGDVPDELPAGFQEGAARLRADMLGTVIHFGAAERVREGFRVAILGRPNAGKSSLLNALARREAAIVTAEEGTTRDVLELPLDVRGYPVLLFDTAGLREAASEAEREGVRRARAAGEAADLVLWLEDSTQESEAPPAFPEDVEVWRVSTKVDLGSRIPDQAIPTSARTREGLEYLIDRIGGAAAFRLGSGSEIVTRERQRGEIERAAATLAEIADAKADEIAADLLRSASEAIGRLTGRIGVEDVLDRLFREFCIGK